jgi:hypothetical protein
MYLSKPHHLSFALFSVWMLLLFPACSKDVQTLSCEKEPAIQVAAAPQMDLVKKWGIEITGIRMTARGHMVDFRYRVVDVDKASFLFKRNVKPYLMDQESGKVLAVPRTAKVGPLQSSSNAPQQGKIYWLFFGNPGIVKTGSSVTVVIGEFKADNLIVQ